MYVKLIFSFVLTAEFFMLCSSVGELVRCIQFCVQKRSQVPHDGKENNSNTKVQNALFNNCMDKCRLRYAMPNLRSKRLKKPPFLAQYELLSENRLLSKNLDKNQLESRISHDRFHRVKLHPELKSGKQLKNQSIDIKIDHSNNVNDHHINKAHPDNLKESNFTANNKTKSLSYMEEYYEKAKEIIRSNQLDTLSMSLEKPSFNNQNDKYISKDDFKKYLQIIFGKNLGQKLIDFLETLKGKI